MAAVAVAAAAAVSLPQGVQAAPVFTHAETEAAEAADPTDFEPPSSPSSNAPKVCAGEARLIASARRLAPLRKCRRTRLCNCDNFHASFVAKFCMACMQQKTSA